MCAYVCFGELKTLYSSSIFIPLLFPVHLCRTLRRAGDYSEIEEIIKRRGGSGGEGVYEMGRDHGWGEEKRRERKTVDETRRRAVH